MIDTTTEQGKRHAAGVAVQDETLFRLGVMDTDYAEVMKQKEELPEAYFNAMYGHLFPTKKLSGDVYDVFKEVFEGLQREFPRTHLMRQLFFKRMDHNKNTFHRKYSRMAYDIMHQFTATQDFFTHGRQWALKEDTDIRREKMFRAVEDDLYAKQDEFTFGDETGIPLRSRDSFNWRFGGAFYNISSGLLFTGEIGSDSYFPNWSTYMKPYLELVEKVRPGFKR
jgi:hypothetical protein